MLKMMKKVLVLVFASLGFLFLSTRAASAVARKDPSCPPGYVDFATLTAWVCGDILKDYCCKGSAPPILDRLTGGYCEAKDNSHIVFINPTSGKEAYCNDYKSKVKLATKTFCSSDGSWKYDEKSKECLENKYEQWSLESKQKDCSTHGKGFDTAIGCIPTSKIDEFLKFLLKWTFFASGGIILLMTIATGYTIITSAGNPEKLQAAKENIVALFSGLFLIAFSLILLQTIGADILKLPTFTP